MKLGGNADICAGQEVPLTWQSVLGCLPRWHLQLPFLMLVASRTTQESLTQGCSSQVRVEMVTGSFPISQSCVHSLEAALHSHLLFYALSRGWY